MHDEFRKDTLFRWTSISDSGIVRVCAICIVSPALFRCRSCMRREHVSPISTKRTHFSFDAFFTYCQYQQVLMTFAGAFANGFVLEKRTHLLVVK